MATSNRRTKNTYGIRTKRLPTGEVRYNAVITVHDPVSGKSKKKELGRRRTLAEAEHDGMEAVTDRSRGVLPWGPNTTLGEFLDSWHEDITLGQHEATTRRVRKIHITLIKRYLGKLQLKGQGPRSLSAPRVQAFVNALGKERHDDGSQRFGAKYIANVLITLRMALKVAESYGYAGNNVAKSIKPPKVKQGREFPVVLMPDTDDWKTFTAACMADINAGIQDGAIFLTAAWQGLRPGESGLSWEDIDFERDILHVQHQLQKNESGLLELRAPKYNSARDIKLLPIVARVLRQHRLWQMRVRSEPGSRWQEPIPHLVFTTHGVQGSGRPIAPDNLGYMWRQFMARHPELPRGLRLHSGLRGSCATRLHYIGMPDGELMKWMGHKDIKTTYGSYVQITKGSMSSWAAADVEFAAGID